MYRLAAVAIVLLGSAAAWAQPSLSLTAESEHRWRGEPLSGGKPGLRLNLDADLAGGWFAGGSVSGAQFDAGTRRTQWLAYAGRARSAGPATSWEIGATVVRFVADAEYDYAEVFAGWMAERWSLRASVSPSYFGSGLRTLYAEANRFAPLDAGRRYRVFAHLGALAVLGGHGDYAARRLRADARLGGSATLHTALGFAELQLAWVGAGRGQFYSQPDGTRRTTWVLSSTLAF